MWVTPYSDEDSDDNINYLFCNDLEAQEEQEY